MSFTEWGPVLQPFCFFISSVCLLWLANVLHRLFTPYAVNQEIRQANVACALSLSGYLLGVTIVMVGAWIGPGSGWPWDWLTFVGYSLLGVLLLNLSRWVNDRCVLHRFCNVHEIVQDRNIGTGVLEFGAYVASALIIAGSVHGEGGGVYSLLVFYLLGQVALGLFVQVYDWLTPGDLHHEFEQDNVAAGVAAGGTLVALGILLMKGTSGHFVSWQYNLTGFGLEILACLLLLPTIRVISNRLVVPQLNLDSAVLQQRNVAAGVLEMMLAITLAILLFFMVDFSTVVRWIFSYVGS
ncbi:MAG: DUF350 domain-containing protein [Candidatus Melainabacteria bacterium]|nr:DUF350 domain-containing protein [Candidatus Melainabacteria bacterium]